MRSALLGLLIGVVAVAGCSNQPPAAGPSGPAGLGHLQVAAGFHSFHLHSTAMQVQSIVQVDANQYLLCDYYDVFRLTRDANGYTMALLGRPAATAWSPAGL